MKDLFFRGFGHNPEQAQACSGTPFLILRFNNLNQQTLLIASCQPA